MTAIEGDWPALTLPSMEAEFLRETYDKARVILEYGSGGSTVLGGSAAGKLIFSVETDRQWALSLQRRFDEADLPSPVIIYHVDIGETGAWGRAKDDSSWRKFYRYPTSIWTENFFRHPEVVLIDGRFRAACLVNACLRAKQPITVLFDDYADRKAYHAVEALLKPSDIIGRMAVFHIEPQEWPEWTTDLLLELCTHATFSSDKVDYDHVPDLPILK
ncbi:hypothetical protein [Sphingomonas sp. VDB2]|uniref:hypothetical protein n=1 Tax=Sphingomonas sp. VDB2 TaxID=3228751 RepID=UPI003A80066E